MKWSEKLKEWEQGIIPKIPKNIKKSFIWRTSVINKNLDTEYKEEFIENDELHKRQQNYNDFLKKPCNLLTRKNKYVISTNNKSNKTCKLIIPKPKKNKNFKNLFFFIKNASLIQQKKLWKKLAKEIKKYLKKNNYVWISTHGFSTNYLHIRISNFPKYYNNSPLSSIES